MCSKKSCLGQCLHELHEPKRKFLIDPADSTDTANAESANTWPAAKTKKSCRYLSFNIHWHEKAPVKTEAINQNFCL